MGEPPDRRSFAALFIGILGVGIIVWGGREETQLNIIAIALTSGLTYAGVIVFLRVLRDASPRWLTVLNQLASALVLLPWIWFQPVPAAGQLFVYQHDIKVSLGLAGGALPPARVLAAQRGVMTNILPHL